MAKWNWSKIGAFAGLIMLLITIPSFLYYLDWFGFDFNAVLNTLKYPLPIWVIIVMFPLFILLIVFVFSVIRKCKETGKSITYIFKLSFKPHKSIKKFTDVAQKLNKTAKKLERVYPTTSCTDSLMSIVNDLLNNQVFVTKIGKGIDGYKLYFDEQGRHANDKCSKFKDKLEEYIKRPKDKNTFIELMHEFYRVVTEYYNLYENFLNMIKKIGYPPSEYVERYKKWKEEYRDFIQSLRNINADLESVTGDKIFGDAVGMLKFAEDLPLPNLKIPDEIQIKKRRSFLSR